MLKLLFNLFRTKNTSVAVITPETDLELLNRAVCPDCGSTEGMTPQTARIIECGACGSAFVVDPCCTPPFLSASHLGFNRKKYAAQRELPTRSGFEDAL